MPQIARAAYAGEAKKHRFREKRSQSLVDFFFGLSFACHFSQHKCFHEILWHLKYARIRRGRERQGHRERERERERERDRQKERDLWGIDTQYLIKLRTWQ
jgi:hypothetical protein